MESMTGCISKIAELQYRLTQHKGTIITLQEIFIKEAQYQYRRDQSRSLDALKGRIEIEIDDIKRMEATASNGFIKGTLIAGLAEFAIGSFVAGISHSHERPLSVGAQLARNSFERTAPFGTVVVAIGPGGVPDEVNVVPLSQWAREQNREESAVMATLEARGRVMTPESFFMALNELKDNVLKGTVILPDDASSLEGYHEGLPSDSMR